MPAAGVGEHAHEVGVGVWVAAAHCHHAGCPERGRGHLLGDGLAEGAEHHVEHTADDLEVAADGRRVAGVDERVLGDGEAHRPEGAAVDGHVGVDVLQGDIARRDRRVARQVGRAGGLPTAVHVVGHRVGVVEVLADLVGLDLRDLVLPGRDRRRQVLPAPTERIQLGADFCQFPKKGH